MVEQYNGMPSSDNGSYITKHYELLVTGVGTEGTGEETLAWVTFMNFSTDMEGGTPATLIKEKDTFVRVDNVSNPDRKGIIQMMTVGTDTPYMDIIYGLKTDPENALKGRVGNLEGIVHPLFGSLSGFGEYLNNLYATGDFVLRRTGESVDTKIQMLQNQFATRFAKTTYDINEATNFLHNGQFLTVLGEEEDSEVIDGWTVDAADETVFWVDDEGLPVMVNNGVTTSGNRRVGIDNVEGRNTLRIQDCGLTQDNALVKQPGTHKEYVKPTASGDSEELAATTSEYKDVQDTLYITAIVYAKTAGTLTMGFKDCTTVEGKENDLAAKDFSLSYTGDWDTLQMVGKWNGTGSFRLAYTGDILVSLVTVTTEPLDNLSKEVSTQIIQTASNIQLLGENVDKVQGTVTTLESTVDAELGEIRTAVGQAATKKEVEENKKTLEDAMATQKTQLQSYANTAANTAATGVRNDYASTITLVNQSANSWNVAAGAFDSKGKLLSTAGAVLTDDFAGLYAKAVEKDTNIQKTANMGVYVQKDGNNVITGATIEADKINLTGHTMAFKSEQISITSSNFTLTTDGEITAKSGTFGIWSINKENTCISASGGSGNVNHGRGWSDYWGDKVSPTASPRYCHIHTEGGSASIILDCYGDSQNAMVIKAMTNGTSEKIGIQATANNGGIGVNVETSESGGKGIKVSGYNSTGISLELDTYNRQLATGINIANATTGISIGTATTAISIGTSGGNVSGLRLPVVTVGGISTTLSSSGSTIAFLTNTSNDQTVTLPSPSSGNNGAVIIIVSITGRSFTVKGSLKQKGSTASSVGLGGDSIALCVCNGSYWNVSYIGQC